MTAERTLEQTIAIGEPEPHELDPMLRLMCEAFGLPWGPAREIFYGDPYFELRNKRVLRVAGRLTSCLTIVETQCWLGSGVIRLAGIAGVATRPECRRQGYAGRLLSETVRTLDERGFALSALFPFSYDYYRKFGWECSGVTHRSLISPMRLREYPERSRVRLVRSEDIPHLERLFNTFSKGRTLHCLRDTKRWKYLLDHVKHRVVYAPDRRRVEGYLLYEHRPGRIESIAPAIRTPPTLRVLELYAATPEARRGLIGHLAEQNNVGSIEYSTTLERLADTGLLEPVETGSADEAMGSIEILPSVMARVISLRRCLEGLREEWGNYTGSPCFLCRDPLAPNGASAALMAGAGYGAPALREVSLSEALRHKDRLEGDARAWAQVIVGHLSGGDACASGLLTASTPRVRDDAERLFPKRSPFVPAPDAF